VRRAGLLTLIGTMFIGKLVSPATRGMSRSSRRRW
ncbi:SreG protein-coupled chemoreceptor family protein, partial [Salmonella enterica subsp. enterica serovar Anatum]